MKIQHKTIRVYTEKSVQSTKNTDKKVNMLIFSFDEKSRISKSERKKALVLFMTYPVVNILRKVGKGVVGIICKAEGTCTCHRHALTVPDGKAKGGKQNAQQALHENVQRKFHVISFLSLLNLLP